MCQCSHTTDTLRLIVANAELKLASSWKSRKPERIIPAIREIVEGSFGDMRPLRVCERSPHPLAKGRPHAAWRWVTRSGVATLLIEATGQWQSLAVSVISYAPGLQRKGVRVFRDETQNPKLLKGLVAAAIRQAKGAVQIT
jgi:hypothetical protein